MDLRAVADRYAATRGPLRPVGADECTAEWTAVLVASVGDVPALLALIRALRARLGTARLRAANLEAAGRATVAALAEGDPDPGFYLRDEIGGGW